MPTTATIKVTGAFTNVFNRVAPRTNHDHISGAVISRRSNLNWPPAFRSSTSLIWAKFHNRDDSINLRRLEVQLETPRHIGRGVSGGGTTNYENDCIRSTGLCKRKSKFANEFSLAHNFTDFQQFLMTCFDNDLTNITFYMSLTRTRTRISYVSSLNSMQSSISFGRLRSSFEQAGFPLQPYDGRPLKDTATYID